jgi:hypothetical protein
MELTTKRLQEEVAYEQDLRRQLAEQLEQQANKVIHPGGRLSCSCRVFLLTTVPCMSASCSECRPITCQSLS